MNNATVTHLFIYPIKSCAGIELNDCTFNQYGFQYDRHWIVGSKKEDGSWKMVTQREYSRMVLIQPKLIFDGGKYPTLILNAPGMDEISINTIITSDPVFIPVWKSEVSGYIQSDLVSKWLSDFLGIDCSLFVKDPELERPLIKKHTPALDKFDYNPQTAFADGFPFLLLSEESVKDFSSQLPEGIAIRLLTFRPNIVVAGLSPYEEDEILSLQIGTIQFFVAARTTRCRMVNNTPEGVPGTEVLKLIQRIRRVDPGAKYEGCMGVNVIHRVANGTISVGDQLIINQKGVHDRRGIWNQSDTPTAY
ncbi:hypothetical protein BC833DRAFT_608071 [Globomyces pollinis-pini]|nr:hypothetical protein BC833DRAFT_608071 [Globomyces pollinis-pini]